MTDQGLDAPGSDGKTACRDVDNVPDGVGPKLVVDGWGNLWRHFNDTGYLRLIVTTDPGRSLADIVSQTGSVKAVDLADPWDRLRDAVLRGVTPERQRMLADIDAADEDD